MKMQPHLHGDLLQAVNLANIGTSLLKAAARKKKMPRLLRSVKRSKLLLLLMRKMNLLKGRRPSSQPKYSS